MTMIENGDNQKTMDNRQKDKKSSGSSGVSSTKASKYCFQQFVVNNRRKHRKNCHLPELSQNDHQEDRIERNPIFSNGDTSSTVSNSRSSCNSSRADDENEEEDDDELGEEVVEKSLREVQSQSDIEVPTSNDVYCNNNRLRQSNYANSGHNLADSATATTNMLMTMMQTMPFLFPQLVATAHSPQGPLPGVHPTTSMSPLVPTLALTGSQLQSTPHPPSSFHNLLSMANGHQLTRSSHPQFTQTHLHQTPFNRSPQLPQPHPSTTNFHQISTTNSGPNNSNSFVLCQVPPPPSSINFSIDSILRTNRSVSSLSNHRIQNPGLSSINTSYNIPNVDQNGLNSSNVSIPNHTHHHHNQHHNPPSSQQFYSWLQCTRQYDNSQNNELNVTSKTSMTDNKQRHLSPPISTTVSNTKQQYTNNCTETTGHRTSPVLTQQSVSTKRKPLNRGPRIPFTTTQVSELEAKFNATQYLSSLEVNQLARRLNLTDTRIRIWFQNRRAREKREQKPQSGDNLEPDHAEDQIEDEGNDDGGDEDCVDGENSKIAVFHPHQQFQEPNNYGQQLNPAKVRRLSSTSNACSNVNRYHFDVRPMKRNNDEDNNLTKTSMSIKCEQIDSDELLQQDRIHGNQKDLPAF